MPYVVQESDVITSSKGVTGLQKTEHYKTSHTGGGSAGAPSQLITATDGSGPAGHSALAKHAHESKEDQRTNSVIGQGRANITQSQMSQPLPSKTSEGGAAAITGSNEGEFKTG